MRMITLPSYRIYFFIRLILLLFSVIRASVPKLSLDDTFEQKNDIAKAVENELEKVVCNCTVIYLHTIEPSFLINLVPCVQAMSHYGFEIVQTLIVDIEPDEHVKRAMNEINAGKYQCWFIYCD